MPWGNFQNAWTPFLFLHHSLDGMYISIPMMESLLEFCTLVPVTLQTESSRSMSEFWSLLHLVLENESTHQVYTFGEDSLGKYEFTLVDASNKGHLSQGQPLTLRMKGGCLQRPRTEQFSWKIVSKICNVGNGTPGVHSHLPQHTGPM